eukprot:CAMPEP_0171304750 /NCGR_PEP_ID=MMETSP0816-20121228/14503_1 /TAXON_ID=420281 /ORGANISM="Proboscia inermis, Strain CCAP1064/1" /LENGTH=63 /DNA_ID=CAMNT_0011785051 /DNA_START=195 /DNA_END=386 /DNA_ORIENTATION=-
MTDQFLRFQGLRVGARAVVSNPSFFHVHKRPKLPTPIHDNDGTVRTDARPFEYTIGTIDAIVQ